MARTQNTPDTSHPLLPNGHIEPETLVVGRWYYVDETSLDENNELCPYTYAEYLGCDEHFCSMFRAANSDRLFRYDNQYGIRTAFKDWIHTKFVWLERNRPNHEIAERIYQENKAELEALLARTLPLEVGV